MAHPYDSPARICRPQCSILFGKDALGALKALADVLQFGPVNLKIQNRIPHLSFTPGRLNIAHYAIQFARLAPEAAANNSGADPAQEKSTRFDPDASISITSSEDQALCSAASSETLRSWPIFFAH
jgi:hypothetical protein